MSLKTEIISEKDKITTYKGFNRDLTCRGYQFEIGKKYRQEGYIECCENGFHACRNPIDVLDFYDLISSRFCIVEQYGEISEYRDKTASRTVNIKEEISANSLIEHAYRYIKNNFDDTEKEIRRDDIIESASSCYNSKLVALRDNSKLISLGRYSQLTSISYNSRLASSGAYNRLTSSGYYNRLFSTGGSSRLSASGDYNHLTSTGGSSRLSASGDLCELVASGYSSQLASAGYGIYLAAIGDYSDIASAGNECHLLAKGGYSRLASTGDDCTSEATGENSVIFSSGDGSKVKGINGTLICLTRFKNGKPVGFVTGKIGENGLKEDTYYMLDKNGELVECCWA